MGERAGLGVPFTTCTCPKASTQNIAFGMDERREALLSWDSVGLSKQAAVHAVQCRPVLALLLESRGVAMPARRAAEAITAALQDGQRNSWTRYEFAAWFVQLQQRYAEKGHNIYSEPPPPHSPPPHQHQHHQKPQPSPPNRLLTPPLEPLDQPEAAARKSPRGGKLRGGDGNRGAHPRRSPPAAASVPFLYDTELPPHATGAQQWALEQVQLACSAVAREQSAEARAERAREIANLVPDEEALVALAGVCHIGLEPPNECRPQAAGSYLHAWALRFAGRPRRRTARVGRRGGVRARADQGARPVEAAGEAARARGGGEYTRRY
jgi:hypothetical protein